MDLKCISYFLVFTLYLAFVVGNEHDHRWKKEEFPSPASNPEICGKSSSICDPAKILTDQEVQKISSEIAASRLVNACDSERVSLRIAVAVVPGLYMTKNGNSTFIPTVNEERKHAAKEFTFYLGGNQYKYVSNCDELVMVVVSRDDKEMELHVDNRAFTLVTSECIERLKLDDNYSLSSVCERLLFVVEQLRNIFVRSTCLVDDAPQYQKQSADDGENEIKRRSKRSSGTPGWVFYAIIPVVVGVGGVLTAVFLFCCCRSDHAGGSDRGRGGSAHWRKGGGRGRTAHWRKGGGGGTVPWVVGGFGGGCGGGGGGCGGGGGGCGGGGGGCGGGGGGGGCGGGGGGGGCGGGGGGGCGGGGCGGGGCGGGGG